MGDYGSYQLIPEGDRLKDVQMPAASIPPSPGHDREFLDSIKSRKQPSCSFEYHVKMAMALTLGHIALNSGQKIHWDAEKGEIIGGRDLRAMAYPNYRKPWQLPK
jgi:hypothetical protein